jgi:uncharacterized protein (TIGR03437 family)
MLRNQPVYRTLLSLAALLAISSSAYGQTTLSLGSGSATRGGSVSLNLSLNTSGSAPAGVQWTVSYPASDVASVSATAGAALTAAGKSLSCNASGGTIICLTSGMNSSVINSGVVAVLGLTLTSTGSASSISLPLSNVIGALPDGTLATVSGSGGTVAATTPTQITASSLQCSPSTVASGGAASCTVTVSAAAASGGVTVALSSNNAAVKVPASVTVAAGATTASFTPTAGTVTTNQTATLAASLNASTATSAMTVTPTLPTVTGLACAPASVVSGGTSSCTVTLSKAAPTGGSPVALSSNNAAVKVPASVTVAAGATTASFTPTAGTVTTNQTATVTASLNASTATSAVTVTPIPLPTVTGLACAPASVLSGSTSSCTITLSAAAPSAGSAVAVSSNSSVLTAPSSVTIAAGAATATFTATAAKITAQSSVTLSASLNGSSATASLTVQPSTPSTASAVTAAYGFEEGTGATTADASGNGNTGLIHGAAWSTSGKHGKALSFNGSTSYVDLGAAPSLQTAGSMTLSAWVCATGNPPNDGQIIARSDSSSGWQLKVTPDTGKRTFAVAVSGTAGRVQRYSVTVYSLNTWYYVAGVYNAAAKSLDIYVNGVLDNGVLSGAVPASQVIATLNPSIGKRSGGYYFKGLIDDVRVYSRPLVASEIQNDMNTAVSANSTVTSMSVPGGATMSSAAKPTLEPSTATRRAGRALSALACSPRTVDAGAQFTCELNLSAGAPSQIQLAASGSQVTLPHLVTARTDQSRFVFQAAVDALAKEQPVTVTAMLNGTSVQDTVLVAPSSTPVLTVPSDRFARFGQVSRFHVSAADPSGLPVDLQAAGVPNTATFNAQTGVFEWRPGISDAGKHQITFTATGANRLASTAQVNIEVGQGLPVITSSRATVCSPGALATLRGKWLTDESSGTIVKVNGESAPVTPISETWVSFLCPALDPGTDLSITVETAAGASGPLSITMQAASPEIFSFDGSGRNQGTVSFAGTTDLVTARNPRVTGYPAQPGDMIQLWATGLGPAAESTPGAVRVQIGGQELAAESIQGVAGNPGVYTVQVRVPANVTFGDFVPVQLLVTTPDGKQFRSNTVTIAAETGK